MIGKVVEDIRNLIRQETKYLARYTATVIDNTEMDGVLTLSCFELGWEDPESYATAYPSQDPGKMVTPEIGDNVEIFFHAGDRNKPKWSGIITEIAINKNKMRQNTNAEKKVIYEDRRTGDYITYDQINSEFKIKSKSGKIFIDSNSVNINATGKIIIESADTVDIKSESIVNLGKAPSNFINNLPNCLFNGAPHSTSTDVKA